MSAWDLPVSLEIGGTGFSIRTDFRDILYILECFNNPNYLDEAKQLIMLEVLYKDYKDIPVERYEEALTKAKEFIDMGMAEDKNKRKPTLMDWEQDAPLIIPGINKVLGQEVRSLPYLHWWTFLSAYMEIGEGIFSSVINIRQKKSKGKKLEKYEQEFYKENKHIIDLKRKESDEEKEAKDEVRKLLGIKK